MPELAEIKIMSDHINNKCSDKKFNKIWKNPVHKSKTDLSDLEKILSSKVYIKSQSRGKELKIDFINSQNSVSLYFMMGMSGNFKMVKKGLEEPKHTHLKFSNDDYDLCMYDLRRFARWRIGKDWNEERGPCPVSEFDSFRKKVLDSLDKKSFKKPIYETLIDQEYFNGIGNYLRAEILGRIDTDPRLIASDYIKNNPSILDLCNIIPREAYQLGGGRLKDWYNNEDLLNSEKGFESWMQFYSNKERCFPIKDKNDRTFWIDKKWI
jgi:endonuclease VIII-like 1